MTNGTFSRLPNDLINRIINNHYYFGRENSLVMRFNVIKREDTIVYIRIKNYLNLLIEVFDLYSLRDIPEADIKRINTLKMITEDVLEHLEKNRWNNYVYSAFPRVYKLTDRVPESIRHIQHKKESLNVLIKDLIFYMEKDMNIAMN